MTDRTATVYIVDDDAAVRDALRLLMKSVGLVCETFASAPEFLKQFDEHCFGCLIADLRMPNMNGLEFLKAKSEDPAIKDIPVVMISTETGADIIDEAKSYGAKGAVKKPFTPDLINDTLGPLL